MVQSKHLIDWYCIMPYILKQNIEKIAKIPYILKWRE